MVNVGSIVLGWSEYPTQDWAVNVYLSGCNHFCEDCQNPSLADPSYGHTYSVSELYDSLVKKCKANRTDKIVFLGGDPLYKDNSLLLNELVPLLSNFHICVYTGYNLDYAKSVLSCLNQIDYLKTGKYIQAQKQLSKKTDSELILSSPNQTMYRIKPEITQISKNGIVQLQDLRGDYGIF